MVDGAAEFCVTRAGGGGGVCITCGAAAAAGIRGLGCSVDPPLESIGGMAGTSGVVAAAGGGSGGMSAMVEADF